MKRLDKSISKNFRPLLLYEEEIRDVVELLANRSKELEIKADGFAFETVDELFKKFAPNRIKQLEITTHDPYISIDLDRISARIYSGSSEPRPLGLFHQSASILQRHSRFYGFLCSYLMTWVAILIHIVVTNFLIKGKQGLIVTGVFLIYWSWAMYNLMLRHARIYLSKADSPGAFWFRNKDNLLVGLITGILGVVLGVVIERYILK